MHNMLISDTQLLFFITLLLFDYEVIEEYLI